MLALEIWNYCGEYNRIIRSSLNMCQQATKYIIKIKTTVPSSINEQKLIWITISRTETEYSWTKWAREPEKSTDTGVSKIFQRQCIRMYTTLGASLAKNRIVWKERGGKKDDIMKEKKERKKETRGKKSANRRTGHRFWSKVERPSAKRRREIPLSGIDVSP